MSEEKIRILICHTDGAVYELPMYEGPPEFDDTLNHRLAGHENHIGNLATVKKADWEKKTYRDGILNEVAQHTRPPGEGTGFGQTFYDVKDNYQLDAMQCWKRHSKTSDCGDYMTDKMRLYPDTKGDRKAEGMSTSKSERPSTFLCQFCPVHSIVMQKKRKAAHMYDKQPGED